MAIVEKQVSVCQSLDSVLDSVIELAKDVAAKKDAAVILSENLPALIADLSALSDVGVEVQNHEALDNTIALKVLALKRLLLPSLP